MVLVDINETRITKNTEEIDNNNNCLFLTEFIVFLPKIMNEIIKNKKIKILPKSKYLCTKIKQFLTNHLISTNCHKLAQGESG